VKTEAGKQAFEWKTACQCLSAQKNLPDSNQNPHQRPWLFLSAIHCGDNLVNSRGKRTIVAGAALFTAKNTCFPEPDSPAGG
jgi:hypothetical protein